MAWRALLLGLVVIAALAAGGAWLLLLDAPPPGGASVEFTISAGETFAEVASNLQHEGLVVSAARTRLLARVVGLDRKTRAGTFRLLRGTRPLRLLDDLAFGPLVLRKVTVCEGWRLAQIAAAVQDSLKIPAEALLSAARAPERRARVGTHAADVEGYLFPDTYLFPQGAAAGAVLDAMIDRFEEVWRELPGAAAAGSRRDDVVTLASIVEAETPLAAEKPRVAAVYLNRLARGWKLQADPTVRYGLGYFEDHLYFKQLDVDTPYNTYLHEGLPPGPIGSPGRDALEAALAPQRPCDDLFFVASGQGGHVFSRTMEAHERARRAARAASPG
ncbi:MAG: endolytic transglycosylase MltG [bacterium]